MQSLTRIEEIHAAPVRASLPPGRGSRKASDGVRVRFKNSDLPSGTTERFTRDVLPLVYDAAGALPPWECPSDSDIVDIWNLVFKDDHPMTMKDGFFPAVKGLVRASPILCSTACETFYR